MGKDIKLSKRCQIIKSQTSQLWRRFTQKINSHNDVHTYRCQFLHQVWRSSKLVKNTFYGYFEGFWSSSYLMSKLTSICVILIMSIYFFVNLLHSPCVWLFDIWHLFDNLTSFWQLDILFIIWHMGNRTHGQWEIMVNILDRDGAPWGMGHMEFLKSYDFVGVHEK